MDREWRPAPLVTSVREEDAGDHALVHVWIRGAKAGTLTVRKNEVQTLLERLLPEAVLYDPF